MGSSNGFLFDNCVKTLQTSKLKTFTVIVVFTFANDQSNAFN